MLTSTDRYYISISHKTLQDADNLENRSLGFQHHRPHCCLMVAMETSLFCEKRSVPVIFSVR